MDAESVARLSDSLGSKDCNERAHAAIELGRHQVTEALPALRKLTTDAEEIAALAGVFGCWCLGEDHVDAKRILDAVTSGDEALMQQAVETVSAIGEPLVVKLAPHLEGSPEEAVAALELLEEIGGSAAQQAIEDADIQDAEVLQEAKEILAEWMESDE